MILNAARRKIKEDYGGERAKYYEAKIYDKSTPTTSLATRNQ
jgi:hypothetical protein